MPPDDHLNDARAWYYDVRFRTAKPVSTWPADFVIITAYATTGETWTPEENDTANTRLERELAVSGIWYAPITGNSSKTGHAEPGFAAALTAAEGTALGRRYRQDAIFVVRDGRLSVRYCADEREEHVAAQWSELVD